LREAVKAFDRVAGFYDDWYSHPQGIQVFKAELKALESLIQDSGLGLEVGHQEPCSQRPRKEKCRR
jgi:hypothetical protein